MASEKLDLYKLHKAEYVKPRRPVLSDPRRVAPEKLRTILRLPVRPRRRRGAAT